MINVDIALLKEFTRGYSDIIKKLEDSNKDIIHNLKELKKYWHDEKVINLSISSAYEIQRMLKLESDAKSQLEIYKYLENEYSKIGKKIKCNLEAKNVLDTKLVNIIDMINNIFNQYNDLGDISFYPKAYVIENQKNNLKELLDSFVSLKENLLNTFNTISSIENTVSDRLEEIEVQMFLFNNFEKED